MDDDYIWIGTVVVRQPLSMQTKHVYRLVDKGVIPAYRFGRVIRYQLAEVLAAVGALER